MKNQKLINLLDHAANQASEFRTKKWVEINDESRGKHDNISIKFNTPMRRTDLCNCSYAYIFDSGTMTITREGDNDTEKKGRQKK